MKMLKKYKYDQFYMDIAKRTSEMSYAKRLQVGSIIVKDGRILSMGWNGMPFGMDNECEDENGLSKPEVLHSESNCLMKMVSSTESLDGAVMYCTHSPCLSCAKLIYQAGIRHLVFGLLYRDSLGLKFLIKQGVQVEKHYNGTTKLFFQMMESVGDI